MQIKVYRIVIATDDYGRYKPHGLRSTFYTMREEAIESL